MRWDRSPLDSHNLGNKNIALTFDRETSLHD
jgi:hypothetical protein